MYKNYVYFSCKESNNFIVFDINEQGPPIHGQCGADYRPSENYAIDSGLKPFVVELKFSKSGRYRYGTKFDDWHFITL